MSENGSGWPRNPQPLQDPRDWQDPPGWQDPRDLRDPRMPQGRGLPQNPRKPQRPQGPHRLPPEPGPDLRPLPPGYEPVHHDPRHAGPRAAGPRTEGRQEDSPWRMTQRQSRPETTHWQPDQPVQASYDPGEYRYADQYPGDGGYEEDDQGRFLPGFGEDGDPGHGDPGYGDPGYGDPGHGDPGYGDPGHYVPAGRGARRAARREGGGGGRGGRGGRRSRRRFRWIAPLAALLVIVVPLAVGGIYAYSLYMNKYHPADYSGDGTGSVEVQVVSGETPTGLAPELVKLGVVASTRAFVLAAEHSANPDGLRPGFYGMRKHMQASLAYALLLDPKNLVQVTVTIPEGWRLSQTAAWLGKKSGIPASEYAKALKDPASLGLPAYANGRPEGYLFPATYQVQPHETALGVLRGMVQRFDAEAATVNLTAAAKRVGLKEGQVIIMASLVQAEGGRLTDYPKIARVIFNRLGQGMPLQLDSTVLYGLNKYGIIASDAELSSPSPYNTYKHTGLPPGPIDSPGNAAIEAVLHPAAGNWLYFVTVNPKTGETRFTSSLAQFEQFRQELQKHLGQG